MHIPLDPLRTSSGPPPNPFRTNARPTGPPPDPLWIPSGPLPDPLRTPSGPPPDPLLTPSPGGEALGLVLSGALERHEHVVGLHVSHADSLR
eukprot:1185764-Prorocentrum_minimum.AAC.1